MHERPHAGSATRDGELPTAHLLGDTAVFGVPGTRAVEEPVAEDDTLQGRCAEHTILDSYQRPGTSRDEGRGVDSEAGLFGGKAGAGNVVIATRLCDVPACSRPLGRRLHVRTAHGADLVGRRRLIREAVLP